jgi:hypothetical protein
MRRKAMKNSVRVRGIVHAYLSGLIVTVATVVMAADVAPTEEWSLAETLGSSRRINVTVAGSAVTVWFAQQGEPPSALRADIMIGGANPSSIFTGNLIERGYSGIRLRITGTGEQPAEAAVVIRRIVQQDPLVTRDWRYQGLRVSPKAGEWTIGDIPLQRSAGWKTAGEYKFSDARLDAMWSADLQDVAMMYVRLQSGGFAEQSYSVSDFQLKGSGVISEAANLSPLQHYFGVESFEGLDDTEVAALMALDSDGDGMSDYHEILAGFDPHNAASVLETRMAAAQGRNTISWYGVLGKSYAVWRSNDLSAGFLPLVDGIRCQATGIMSIDDENPAADSPNFYKVVTY